MLAARVPIALGACSSLALRPTKRLGRAAVPRLARSAGRAVLARAAADSEGPVPVGVAVAAPVAALAASAAALSSGAVSPDGINGE